MSTTITENSIQTVPYLRALCLNTIIANWAQHPHLDVLSEPEQRKVLKRLSLDLELRKSLLIADNDYWRRRCELKWKISNVAEYDGSFRRMYLERLLEENVENFVPAQSEMAETDELIDIVKNDVTRVRLSQLLPPVPQVKEPKATKINGDEEVDDDESDEDDEEDDQPDHVDLGLILPKLNNLTHLELSFAVKDVGMNFEWGFFTFTMKDADMLASCLAKCYSLEQFHLTKSRLEDEQCRLIVKRLLKHPRLKSISLAHNRLRDRTGRALGKLIKSLGTLRVLNVEDNEIGQEGATAIALGFADKMAKLEELNIAQNTITDEGGIAIAKALGTNGTLTSLSIGANGLGPVFAKTLSTSLTNNCTLTDLNIGADSAIDFNYL